MNKFSPYNTRVGTKEGLHGRKRFKWKYIFFHLRSYRISMGQVSSALMGSRRCLPSLPFFPEAKLESHHHILVPTALHPGCPHLNVSKSSSRSIQSTFLIKYFFIIPCHTPCLRSFVLPNLPAPLHPHHCQAHFPSLEGMVLCYSWSLRSTEHPISPEKMLIVSVGWDWIDSKCCI